MLVTTSDALAVAVAELTEGWPQVRCEVVATLAEAIARADEYAAEHVELHVADPDELAGRLTSAGSVFLGASTPAVLGDYAVGANHVLPTGGLARGSGGLGLEAFLKPIQYVRATDAGLAAARETVAALARVEGFPLHAAAVEERLAAVTGS